MILRRKTTYRTPGRRRKARRWVFPVLGLVLLAVGALALLSPPPVGKGRAGLRVVVAPPPPQAAASTPLTRQELSGLLGQNCLPDRDSGLFTIQDEEGRQLFIRTTLDENLQAWAARAVARAQAPGAAIVALDPKTGRVLALASYSEIPGAQNLALVALFPAASLFKIVTAAGAVEKGGLSRDSRLAYDGRPHTLYKNQVNEPLDSGSHQVTLQSSFARSINTVFGKLGAFCLGVDGLTQFAANFYFNQDIEFELPLETSHFQPPGDDYFSLAEIASGFNRTTSISPLHSALLAAAVANDGLLMAPFVIEEVFDGENHIHYRAQPRQLGRVMLPETAGQIKAMMRATLTQGTAVRSFGSARFHPVLGKLKLGGKTGSLDDEDGRQVDWFVSYALSPQAGDLALSVLVTHSATALGVRSRKMAREALITYYKPRL